jgi:hypothetical protein
MRHPGFVEDQAQGSASEYVFRIIHFIWAAFLLSFLVCGIVLDYIHYDKLTYWSFTIMTVWFVLSFFGYWSPFLMQCIILFLLPVALGVSLTVMFLIVAVIVRDPSVFWHATKMFGGDVSFSVAYAGDHFLHFFIPVTLWLHICAIHSWVRCSLFHAMKCWNCVCKTLLILWTLFGALLVLLLYNIIFDPQSVYQTDFPVFLGWAVTTVLVIIAESVYLLLMLSNTTRHFTSRNVPTWMEVCQDDSYKRRKSDLCIELHDNRKTEFLSSPVHYSIYIPGVSKKKKRNGNTKSFVVRKK